MPKITELSALTTPANNDDIAIVDSDEASTKKISREDFLTGSPLPADTVDTQSITDANVTTAKLADASVTSEKITDAAITNRKSNPTIVMAVLGSNSNFGNTETDILTATAIVPDVNSSVVFTLMGIHTSDQPNESYTLRIKESTTTLASFLSNNEAASNRKSFCVQAKITGVTAGSHTYKFTAQRTAGVGTHTITGTNNNTTLKIEYFAE